MSENKTKTILAIESDGLCTQVPLEVAELAYSKLPERADGVKRISWSESVAEAAKKGIPPSQCFIYGDEMDSGLPDWRERARVYPWIPVNGDSPPPFGEVVLLGWYDFKSPEVGVQNVLLEWVHPDGSVEYPCPPDFWMPLPKVPEKRS